MSRSRNITTKTKSEFGNMEWFEWQWEQKYPEKSAVFGCGRLPWPESDWSWKWTEQIRRKPVEQQIRNSLHGAADLLSEHVQIHDVKKLYVWIRSMNASYQFFGATTRRAHCPRTRFLGDCKRGPQRFQSDINLHRFETQNQAIFASGASKRAEMGFGHWPQPRPAQGQVVQRPWKDEQAHNFQCDGIISINPCFEAAMEAIQSRGLARNEVERPLPALNCIFGTWVNSSNHCSINK